MLVLTRRLGEEVVLPELDVRLRLVGISPSAARIGISAPASVSILRCELLPAAAGRVASPPPAHHAVGPPAAG